MYRLSQYVEDPLASRSDVWLHPVTGSVVRLNSALLEMLPAIVEQDLQREASGPEQVLHQLLAAELSDRGFLIPAMGANTSRQMEAEDEFLGESLPMLMAKEPFLGAPICEAHDVSEVVRVAFLGVPGPIFGDRHGVGLGKIRDICRGGPEGHSISRLENSRPLDLRVVRDLGDLLTPSNTISSCLRQIAKLIAGLPETCVPVIVGDDASYLYGLMQGLRDQQRRSGYLLVFDHVLRAVGTQDDVPRRLPPVHGQNVMSHIKKDFPTVPVLRVGLDSFQSMPTSGESCPVPWGPYVTDMECSRISEGESSTRLPVGQRLVIGLNVATLARQCHTGLGLQPATLMATIGKAVATNEVCGVVLWGLDALTGGLPETLGRTLVLSMVEGLLG